MFGLLTLFKKKDHDPYIEFKKESARRREAKEVVSVKASDSLYHKNERYVKVVIEGFKLLGYTTYIGEFDEDAVYFAVDRVKKKVVGCGSLCGWPQDSIDIVHLAELDLNKKAP